MDGRITAQAPGRTALLIIDMMNELDFDDADAIRDPARDAAAAILKLRDAADARDVPVIYVNDNGGRWHSDRTALIDTVIESGGAGAEIARMLRPRDKDYFVIKPQFSGFYATNLPVLLPKLEASRLILTGIAADICVLFTAADAHMREYDLWVPGDAIASFDSQRTRWSLDIMRQTMGADVRTLAELTMDAWLERA